MNELLGLIIHNGAACPTTNPKRLNRFCKRNLAWPRRCNKQSGYEDYARSRSVHLESWPNNFHS